jgi:hypothetical protein
VASTEKKTIYEKCTETAVKCSKNYRNTRKLPVFKK